LAVEVKNPAKTTFLSFNTTAVFLHDVMVSENDVFVAGWCIWCVFVGNFGIGLFVWTTIEWIRAKASFVQRFT